MQAEAEPPKLSLPPVQEEGGPDMLSPTQEAEGGPVDVALPQQRRCFVIFCELERMKANETIP